MIFALAAIGFVTLMVAIPSLIAAVLAAWDDNHHRPSWRCERGARWNQ